jgi:D-alanyl-D-alanine carboxypeptidase (penicillin-binding protein 5/6)
MPSKINRTIIIVILCFFSLASVYADQIGPQPSFTGVASGMAIPTPPDLGVKSYLVMDANSGHIIAEKNANESLAPASLTKVMPLYLAAEALMEGRVSLHDQTIVSEKAWRTGGSRMFIRVGTSVAIDDLIKGIAVASGNDAAVALVEHLFGSEEVGVEMMNQKAKQLGMLGTNYADSSGLPHRDTYSTAADQAKLAVVWLKNFPDYYHWFGEKWFSYSGIKQSNRNRLLWRDSSVDGLKTGHTDGAGYCLVSSAKRGQMRLVAVVMGAATENIRANQSMALLNYGFRFFESHKLFSAGNPVATPKVYLGKKNSIPLGFTDDFYITLPARQHKKLKANVVLAKKNLRAPIIKGKVYGVVNIMANDKIVATKQLVALADNKSGNFFFNFFDYAKLLFRK